MASWTDGSARRAWNITGNFSFSLDGKNFIFVDNMTDVGVLCELVVLFVMFRRLSITILAPISQKEPAAAAEWVVLSSARASAAMRYKTMRNLGRWFLVVSIFVFAGGKCFMISVLCFLWYLVLLYVWLQMTTPKVSRLVSQDCSALQISFFLFRLLLW